MVFQWDLRRQRPAARGLGLALVRGAALPAHGHAGLGGRPHPAPPHGHPPSHAAEVSLVHTCLSPQGALGLSLTLGALLLVIAIWLFGALLENILALQEQ